MITFKLPYPNLVSGLPDLLMGLTFLVTWIDPNALGERMVSYLFQVMLLEFIIIHSSGFMAGIIYSKMSKSGKLFLMLGLSVFYILFVIAFAVGFNSWWPVIAFAVLMLNRMLGVITGQAEAGKEIEFVKSMWAVNVACYILSVFFVFVIPLPELGVSKQDLGDLSRMSGEFIDWPYKMIAWGFFYFTLVSVFELLLFRPKPARDVS